LLVIAGLVTGLRALPLFALVLTIVPWVGLSWIYVISQFEYSSYLDSTKERVIAAIVLGGAALTPLLATEIWASWTDYRPSRRLILSGPPARLAVDQDPPRSGGPDA